MKWLFTHPFPGSWVIFSSFFLTPQTQVLPCLSTWLLFLWFLLSFLSPRAHLMLSLLNHSKRSLALTALSVLHYAMIPQESGIFLMQTTSQDFHPSLPGECPDNVLLSTWLLLRSMSCWNHFHTNDHFSLPISLLKQSWIIETFGLPRWLRWWGICSDRFYFPGLQNHCGWWLQPWN